MTDFKYFDQNLKVVVSINIDKIIWQQHSLLSETYAKTCQLRSWHFFNHQFWSQLILSRYYILLPTYSNNSMLQQLVCVDMNLIYNATCFIFRAYKRSDLKTVPESLHLKND